MAGDGWVGQGTKSMNGCEYGSKVSTNSAFFLEEGRRHGFGAYGWDGTLG